MLHVYTTYNAAMATTAATAAVTTGTAIKTMLQLSTPSTRKIHVVEWGFTIDDPPGADAVVELIQTDVAATVTAHVASGVQPIDANLPPSLLTLGTANTGFTATAEGTTTASRTFDIVSLSSVSAESAPMMTYVKQFLPYAMPVVDISKFLRVRVTTPTTAVDMRCWVRHAE